MNLNSKRIVVVPSNYQERTNFVRRLSELTEKKIPVNRRYSEIVIRPTIMLPYVDSTQKSSLNDLLNSGS
jgi:hypothetical protein